ncbi:MAG TPA: hypothetical protein VIJ62_00405 [Rhizomicrobium sp.]
MTVKTKHWCAAVVAGSISFTPKVWAENSCSALVGTTIAPVTIDAVIAKVSKLPLKKDEFESSDAYAARLQLAQSSLSPTYIVSIPFDPTYAIYNADEHKFEVQSYALANVLTDYTGVFGYGTPLYGQVKFAGYASPSSSNLDIAVSSKEARVGTYQGSNAFGVNATIARVKKLTKTIFEREGEVGEPGEDLFFAAIPYGQKRSSNLIFEIPADPQQARTLKTSMKGAVVIAPKPPFFAQGKVDNGAPTIDSPRDVSETLQVVLADIKCAIVTDGQHVVLATYDTR